MRSLLLLFGLTLFTGAVSLKWVFQAVEQTRAVAAAGIVAQLGFAAGAFSVRGPEHVLRLPVAQLAGEAAGAVVLGAVFVKRFGGLLPSLEWRFCRTLLRESAPLAVSTVLGTLLFNFDVLALAYFRTPAEVGLYAAVYKLVLVFTTVLTLFQLSLFPTLARAYQGQHDLDAIAGRALHYLSLIFVPLAFGGLLFAPRLVEWVLGAGYAAGSGPLRILLWSLPWMALRAVFRIILVSYNLQGLDASAMLAGAVVNVALDLILVPRVGATGAAISTLCSEFIILHQSYRSVWRKVQPVFVLKHLYRPAIGSVVMVAAALALWWTPAMVRAAAAAGIYLAVMRFLGAVRWQEIAELWATEPGAKD
jgi:O-antigen/teichoic acid export membrane protein